MPERNFDALNGEQRDQVLKYVPGYDWVPGRFGPPPGIPKARKDEFDRMTDKEYLYAFLKLSQEEKESLMVSEVERRRTFAAHWPIESIVKAHDCAKEGFYYTGVADRVQCAFCGGIVRNWERGDVPKFQHKNFFSYCKMVQNKPCQNIPVSNQGLPKDLMTNQLSSAIGSDNRPTTLGDLNINVVKAKDPALSTFGRRKDSFKRYPQSNPIEADKLCDAGFIYEGIGDKVKCFWCDGALEMWSKGDDPWTEHAKWYPGCTYVQQTKGLDFIRKARSQMSPDNMAVSDTLNYNKGDVSFLDEQMEVEPEVVTADKMEGYKFCLRLGYTEDIVKRAYKASGDKEFEDQAKLVEIVQDLEEGVTTSFDEYIRESEMKEQMEIIPEGQTHTTTKPRRKIDVPDLITKQTDPTDQECRDLINAIRCKKCKRSMAGAVILPCGCFCICQDCSKGNLPQRCPGCNNIVKGACRTFLS